MKILLYGDLHFGRGTKEFLNYQLKFLENCLTKTQKEYYSVFLGDVFHNRVSTDNFILDNVIEYFYKHEKNFIEPPIIVCGNHDTYYKNTNEVNSLKVLKSCSIVYDNQIEELHDGNTVLIFVPWQFDNSFEKWVSEYTFDKNKKYYCFGHFDILGMKMNKGKVSEHGFSLDLFKNFNITFSGHYHTKSEMILSKDSKILYVGTPWQLDRGDINEKRGIHIFDTETQEIEFIENDISIRFEEITYPEEPTELKIKNNYIDLYFEDVVSQKEMELYVNKINEFVPSTLNVRVMNTFKTGDTKEMSCKNTLDLINEYVSIQDISNKDQILERLVNLYNDVQKQ